MAVIIYNPKELTFLSGNTDKIINQTLPYVVITNTTENDVFFSKDESDLGNTDAQYSRVINPGESDYIPASWGVSNHFYVKGTGKVKIETFSTELAASQRVIINNQKAIMGMTNNPNLLINPNFAINQRGKIGTITDIGYFVDRWQLESGSVTVNSDGSITLDGTIKQILDNALNTDAVPSASAGVPSYDDSTKTYTLSASGEIITWAKLELGSKTTQFCPPNPAIELMKCQRYYYSSNAQIVFCARNVMVPYQNYYSLPVTMRVNPTIRIYDAEGTEGYASLRQDNSAKVAISTACANGRDFNIWATNGDMLTNSEYRMLYTADAEII